jgi:hypothetical protein
MSANTPCLAKKKILTQNLFFLKLKQTHPKPQTPLLVCYRRGIVLYFPTIFVDFDNWFVKEWLKKKFNR